MPQKKQAVPAVLPGDVVQITAVDHDLRGSLAIVSEVKRRHIGVTVSAVAADGGAIRAYQRLRHDPDAFAIIGAAALLTPEVQKARVDAIETARIVAKEQAGG